MAIANFFKRFAGDANKIVAPSALSPDTVKKVADHYGLHYIPGKDGFDSVIIPKGFEDMAADRGNIRSFLEFWVDNGSEITDIENDRLNRYQIYEKMDSCMTEAIMTLDAYADEMFSVGFLDNAIEIDFDDKELEKQVKTILKKSSILENARADGRNLCKYGDVGYQILIPDNGNKDNITIKVFTAKDFKAVLAKGSKVPIGYQILTSEMYPNEILKKLQIDKTIPPWLFIQTSVTNLETRPYGRSLLEGMRVVFDQLMTIEGLLALSRASKVERLVVKIPTGNNNPTHAMSKLNQFKSQWKNIIFQESGTGNVKSKGKIAALTEVLFMPAIDGFAIDKIQSNIDISSVDDVEYFRDKALLATGLPKGYFVTDAGGGLGDQGNALRAQDLKFARKLVPYEKSYAIGLTKLCMCLAVIIKPSVDLSELKIKVKIKRPPQVAQELLEIYSGIFENVGKMLDTFKRCNQTDEGKDPVLPKTLFKTLLRQLGLPDELANLFDESKLLTPKPSSSDNSDEDEKEETNHPKGYYSIVDSSDVYKQYFESYFDDVTTETGEVKENENMKKLNILRESLHNTIVL